MYDYLNPISDAIRGAERSRLGFFNITVGWIQAEKQLGTAKPNLNSAPTACSLPRRSTYENSK
jgi:hypothetical protein